jgi:carbamoyltransferase
MIILGIADNHDSGAAVLIDGVPVAAVNQERVDRVKNSGAFPWGAIDAALDLAGVSPREVDEVVVGSAFTPSALLRLWPSRHQQAKKHGQFSPLLHGYILYQSILKKSGLYAIEVEACQNILERRLAQRPFRSKNPRMIDHHRAHAEGAYRTQPHDDCLVLTVDAMGDGNTATVSQGQGGELDLLWQQSGLASLNTFYSRVTELLGFTPNRHEGKITGLAAYAVAPEPLLDHLRQRVRFNGPGFSRMPLRRAERADDPFWAELRRYSREEVAAAAQQILEECVVAFVRYWVERTGCPRLAVAGGAFANVKLNQRIASLSEVHELWVYPHMGDGGLALGGALAEAGSPPTALPHAFLGIHPGETDAAKALNIAGLPRTRATAMIDEVAQLLAAGKVVARCSGPMEWGPRALGNRSVLYKCDEPEVNRWLNERLKRSEFMPFAPICRAEDADRWFQGVDKAARSARFMTVCFDVRSEFAQRCPAAVHVDGTARPQLVDAATSPELHALLGAVGERTGTPVLINTSFNMHEEPIVATAQDAVRAWKAAELDALWLGPYLVRR